MPNKISYGTIIKQLLSLATPYIGYGCSCSYLFGVLNQKHFGVHFFNAGPILMDYNCNKEIIVIYKEILVPIMMIEHTIFTRSNTILPDQNACLLSYNIMEEGLVKILLD